MRTYLSTIIYICICISACKTPNTPVVRIHLSPQIITDSLYTMLPGKIQLCDHYCIWQDAFAADTFLHVVDLNTGQEIGKMGKIGRGPEEFLSPNPFGSFGKHVLVMDDNLTKCAIYSIDSLEASRNPYIPHSNIPLNGIGDIVAIDTSTFIALQFTDPVPFHVIHNGQTISRFGEFPIPDSISNTFDVLQGTLAYHPEKEQMLYSTNRFPYFALYTKNNDGSFKLKKEYARPIRYTIKSKYATLSKNNQAAFRDPTFTKDYIIFRKQDEEHPLPKQEKTTGVRDLSSLPQSIYVFDYHLNLQKIIHLDMSLLRITGTPKNNTIHILGLKNSYCIAQCDIEQDTPHL